MAKAKNLFDLCMHAEDHTPCPEGYLQWHAWAEKMSKTHRAIRCGECGLYTIWIPKANVGASGNE